MHANQKPRRRHSEQFKAQVLAACGEPGASVSAVALSFGLNTNLVRQWQRGRGYKPNRIEAEPLASATGAQFVALPLPAPSEPGPAAAQVRQQEIRVQVKRGSLTVEVMWPLAAGGECAAWLRELLR